MCSQARKLESIPPIMQTSQVQLSKSKHSNRLLDPAIQLGLLPTLPDGQDPSPKTQGARRKDLQLGMEGGTKRCMDEW